MLIFSFIAVTPLRVPADRFYGRPPMHLPHPDAIVKCAAFYRWAASGRLPASNR
jgi:hypothetical protein